MLSTGLKSILTKYAKPTALLRRANPVGMIHIVATDFNPFEKNDNNGLKSVCKIRILIRWKIRILFRWEIIN
jgi:hypothetical protein